MTISHGQTGDELQLTGSFAGITTTFESNNQTVVSYGIVCLVGHVPIFRQSYVCILKLMTLSSMYCMFVLYVSI